MADWDARFLAQAKEVAQWSKDPDKQVGAVLVSPDRRQVCWGFNGFPVGIADTPLRLGDKALKNRFMVHAELNAILNARRDLTGWTMYCTHPPCMKNGCCHAIIQSGIVRVVRTPIVRTSSWWVDQMDGDAFLEEAKVGVTVMEGTDFNGS